MAAGAIPGVKNDAVEAMMASASYSGALGLGVANGGGHGHYLIPPDDLTIYAFSVNGHNDGLARALDRTREAEDGKAWDGPGGLVRFVRRRPRDGRDEELTRQASRPCRVPGPPNRRKDSATVCVLRDGVFR